MSKVMVFVPGKSFGKLLKNFTSAPRQEYMVWSGSPTMNRFLCLPDKIFAKAYCSPETS